MSLARQLSFATEHGHLFGQLTLPDSPQALVLIAAGGDAHGPQARLATALAERPLAILNMDLLTSQELHYPDFAHNVPLLTQRFLQVLEYLRLDGDTCTLPIGLFAVGDIAAAALRAAAQRDTLVGALAFANALIDRAGRQYLEALNSPLLMLLTPDYADLEAASERAFAFIGAEHALQKVEDRELANVAARWLEQRLIRI